VSEQAHFSAYRGKATAGILSLSMPPILIVDDNAELLILMTRLFEQAGYQVVGAHRGKQALEASRSKPPALAVLDILLPDMMGYQLAEALRREHPQLPVVFVTGVFKGGRHALEAKRKYGAVGYFEKPFDSQKLLQTVLTAVPLEEHIERPAEDPFEVELDVNLQDDDPASQNPMEVTGVVQIRGPDHLHVAIRAENPSTPEPIPEPSAAAVQITAPPMGTQEAPPQAAFGGQPSQRGELKDNLPSLINAFYLSGQTGELGVQRRNVKKIIYFFKGQPAFALSNLLSERFGQFLLRVRKITPEQLDQMVAVAKASNRRIGDVLIDHGILKQSERMYYVGQQVKSIIYSLFAWEEGSYVLSFKDKATAEPIKLDVHPATLITRGVKKFYKPERLQRLVRREDRLIPSLQPAYQLHEVELEKWEAQLLPRIDGTRQVDELAALAQKSEPEVLAFLHSLMALNILERHN
jgi:CheY-like chemotaxis protein